MPSHLKLQVEKLAHTLVWLFFASCVLAIPWLAWTGEYRSSLLCAAIALFEVMVLMLNRWRCPLTAVAARYTNDRRENFDIYLPRLLAKYNKQIFGTLYVVGTLYALAAWFTAPQPASP